MPDLDALAPVRLGNRVAKAVVNTLREEGAVVAMPDELRESAKAHIRAYIEAGKAAMSERNEEAAPFDWSVALVALDSWEPQT